MEKIYVGHSSKLDYKKEIYEPIRKSELNLKFDFILPHEKSDEPFNSRDGLKECKAMIAEISYPSIALGIEVGWADLYSIPIIFVFKKGTKISQSLKVVSSNFIEYEDSEDLMRKLIKTISSL